MGVELLLLLMSKVLSEHVYLKLSYQFHTFFLKSIYFSGTEEGEKPKILKTSRTNEIMNKQIFTIVFCLFSVISISVTAQTFSGGNGTETDPYLISSKADMEAMVNKGSGYFLLTQDITETVTTIIKFFGGTFDGGMHTINVNIDKSSASDSRAGVFGSAYGATIKNLRVKGGISATNISQPPAAVAYAGGICGDCTNTTIMNCSFDGMIVSNSISAWSSSNSYAGGICGYISDNSNITNCFTSGLVSSSSCVGMRNSNNAYAGGICGLIDTTSTVSNCIVSANVNSENSCGSSGSHYEGRIAYVKGGNINNCYALASMLVNGYSRSSQDANSNDGKDIKYICNIDFLNNIGTVFDINGSTCTHSITTILLNTSNPLSNV